MLILKGVFTNLSFLKTSFIKTNSNGRTISIFSMLNSASVKENINIGTIGKSNIK